MPPLLDQDILELLNSSASSFGSTKSVGLGKDSSNINNNTNPGEYSTSDHSSSSNNNKKRSRRSVHFSTKVLVKETLHAKNFTKDEHEAYWMTKQDFDWIGAMQDLTLQLLAFGVPETDDICYRGMYNKTKKEKKRYSQLRKMALHAVLQEQKVFRQKQQQQKRQRTEEAESSKKDGRGAFDENNQDSLSLVYSAHTNASQEVALKRAQQDFEDIKEYLTASSPP